MTTKRNVDAGPDLDLDRIIIGPKAALNEILDLRRRLEVAETKNVEASRHINDLLEANNRYLQQGRNWRLVERMRAGEGNMVMIVCDNPDFNGQPNSKVICSGDWTGWEELSFTGDNITAALESAYLAWSRKMRLA